MWGGAPFTQLHLQKIDNYSASSSTASAQKARTWLAAFRHLAPIRNSSWQRDARYAFRVADRVRGAKPSADLVRISTVRKSKFLVNRSMNKSQQMRWSGNGADLLLQVRCAIYNSTLGFGF
jgi:hypothetical protein